MNITKSIKDMKNNVALSLGLTFLVGATSCTNNNDNRKSSEEVMLDELKSNKIHNVYVHKVGRSESEGSATVRLFPVKREDYKNVDRRFELILDMSLDMNNFEKLEPGKCYNMVFKESPFKENKNFGDQYKSSAKIKEITPLEEYFKKKDKKIDSLKTVIQQLELSQPVIDKQKVLELQNAARVIK